MNNTVPLDRVADVVSVMANKLGYAEDRRQHIAAVFESVAWMYWAPVLDHAPDDAVLAAIAPDVAQQIEELAQRAADELEAIVAAVEQREVPV